MRNPARARNLSMGVALACAAILAVSLLFLQSTLGRTPAVMIAVFSGFIGVIALAFAVLRFFDARLQNELRRGEGVLTSWKVDDALWQRFLRAEARRAPQTPTYISSVHKFAAAPEGMTVVVGERAVLVGDDLLRVPTRNGDRRLQSAAVYRDDVLFTELLFCTIYYKRYGGPTYFYEAIRFPVAEGSFADMTRVVDRYRATEAEKRDRRSLLQRYPRRIRNISGALTLVCAAVAGAGIAFRHHAAMGSAAAQGTVVACTVITIFGALFTLVAQTVVWKSKPKDESQRA